MLHPLPPARARPHAALLLGAVIGLCSPAGAQSQPVIVKDAVRYDAGVLGYAGVGDSNANDNFGIAAADIGDLDGDGITDIAFGHKRDDDVDDPIKLGGPGNPCITPGKYSDNGALWVVFLNADGTPREWRKISASSRDAPPLDVDKPPEGAGCEDDTGIRGFGQAVDGIGDLDGDGTPDLVVGVNYDEDGTTEQTCARCGQSAYIDTGFGSIFVLFMNPDATIKAWQKISKTQGVGNPQGGQKLSAGLLPKDYFGAAVCSMGDFNGDGLKDVLVGSPGTHKVNPATGGAFPAQFAEHVPDTGLGCAWVLSLAPDGTVALAARVDLTTLHGVLPPPNDILLDGTLTDEYGDEFGRSVAWLGDLDGPGPPTGDDPVNSLTTIAVGAPFDDDGPPSVQGRYGAVWIIGLDVVGNALKIVELKKISATRGGFHADLDERDLFGISMDAAGDWNGDGITDLAVGAQYDDDGWANSGAVYILMLNRNGTVKSHLKISDTTHGMPDPLVSNGQGVNFGSAVASVGDFDGNGTIDFIAGAELYDPLNRGAGWLVTTDVPRMTLGDRLDADVAPNNGYTFTFEATAGTRVKMTAIQRLSGMEPALRILGPLVEGQEPEVLVDVEDTISKKDTPKARRKAKLPKSFAVPATGEYLVEVLDHGGQGGTFRMKAKGKPAKATRKVVRDIEIGKGEEVFDAQFDATSGAIIQKMAIKALAPKGDFAVIDGVEADLHPALDAVVTPAAGPLDLDGLVKVNKAETAVSLKKLPLAGLGEYTVEISGVDGSVGYARLKASVKIPKGKAKIELP